MIELSGKVFRFRMRERKKKKTGEVTGPREMGTTYSSWTMMKKTDQVHHMREPNKKKSMTAGWIPKGFY